MLKVSPPFNLFHSSGFCENFTYLVSTKTCWLNCTNVLFCFAEIQALALMHCMSTILHLHALQAQRTIFVGTELTSAQLYCDTMGQSIDHEAGGGGGS